MRVRPILLLISIATIGWLQVPAAHAAVASNILVVDQDGFGDPFDCTATDPAFTTIQSAVDAAAPDDFIVVCPGTYGESVTVPAETPRLRVLGAQFGVDARTRNVGAENETIVDPPTGPAFSLLASNTVLDGFTIQGATDAPGIYTSPDQMRYKIQNDIVTDNVFGVHLNSSDGGDRTLVRYCLFTENNETGTASGNAIYSDQGLSNAKIRKNLFADQANSAIEFPYVNDVANSTILIESNRSVDNGHFLSLFNVSTMNVTGNRTADTTSLDDATQGSAIEIGGQTSDVVIQKNIFGHPALSGVEVHDDGLGTGVASVSLLDNLVFRADQDGLHVTSSVPGVVSAAGNTFKNNGGDGISMGASTSDDALKGNKAAGNAGFDCHDQSIGSRPTGTANIWRNDLGTTDDPATLCTPPA
jgi:hypothetical protein